jgi:hypothetical protein
MLEDLRDFKAVNWRTDLELDLGAGTWSEGRGVQKKHRAVIVIVGLLWGLHVVLWDSWQRLVRNCWVVERDNKEHFKIVEGLKQF